MNNGWIKLHRRILENPIVRKPKYITLWIVILLKANHKEKEMIWNNDVISVKSGQFITGRKELSRETGIPETTIERILKFLESRHQIRQHKTTKYRLITIVNWQEYQILDTKTDNKRTTNGQQTDTNKNDNKDNKEKKETPPHAKLSYLDNLPEDHLNEFHVKYHASKEKIKEKSHDLANWCRSEGKKKKNYRAFLLRIMNKDFEKRDLDSLKRIIFSREEVKENGTVKFKNVPNELFEVAKKHKLIQNKS